LYLGATMQKFFGFIFTPLYLVCFGLVLVFFQPIQWLMFNTLGYKAQQQVVYVMNWCLMRCIHVMGGRIWFKINVSKLPTGRVLIFAANHQSMNDIPAMIWFLRKFRPVFVAKQELSKGIPGISYNYKCGGAVGINRKDSQQAREAIAILGKRIAESGESVCIFPEGTRSRDGNLRKFQPGGIKVLLEYNHDAVIIPIYIQNSWKLVRWGFKPIPFGIKLRWDMLEPVDCRDKSADQAVEELEMRIQQAAKAS
jgi:1-acyl-sn-glycerol-3-phosphate acyltransferase